MTAQSQALTLSQLNRHIAGLIAATPTLQNVWVTGETVDVRVAGGHCYLELIEKDAAGRPLAKARATIWASTFRDIAARFFAETGQQFRSDLKVMVLATVNFHPVFGLALNITAINSAYSLGDAMQRRAQMIEQLRRDGIIDMNRSLPWPCVPSRVAIISAKGAAGYGDFINQLCNNALRLRFTARLFPATLQGERTAPSIIAALDAIAAEIDNWDCVVIIRGGGATSDLAAFDDYALAANIAQFPLPVIIGIGHERDITLLDYVANMRVKTPTAAAEWLLQRGEAVYGRLQALAAEMLQAVTDRISGCHRQLAYFSGQLPASARNRLLHAGQRLLRSQTAVVSIADKRIRPELAKLDATTAMVAQASRAALAHARQKLDASAALLGALSPEATLRRGYTITRVDGHAVTSAAALAPGATLTTIFADGEATSTVVEIDQSSQKQ